MAWPEDDFLHLGADVTITFGQLSADAHGSAAATLDEIKQVYSCDFKLKEIDHQSNFIQQGASPLTKGVDYHEVLISGIKLDREQFDVVYESDPPETVFSYAIENRYPEPFEVVRRIDTLTGNRYSER